MRARRQNVHRAARHRVQKGPALFDDVGMLAVEGEGPSVDAGEVAPFQRAGGAHVVDERSLQDQSPRLVDQPRSLARALTSEPMSKRLGDRAIGFFAAQ